MLSRHQRNPDELDISSNSTLNIPVDPLHIDRHEASSANPNISSRLRHRNATASTSRMTNHATNAGSSQRNVNADDSDDDMSDPEDNKPLGQMVTKSPQRDRSSHAIRAAAVAAAAAAAPTTATRVSRTQKRPHYNEDSDESMNDHYATNSHHIRGSASATATVAASHPSKRRHIDDTSSEDDGEPEISVSSRGRVRKISSKVRGYFRE